MIRYLEVPDFHFDPKWANTSLMCGEAVKETAHKQGVDFILCPGDLFNRPIYASEKGGVNIIRKIIKSWLEICPVAAIEGTPSHDAKGCYGFLEDMGLVLLNPKSAYGYYDEKTEWADKKRKNKIIPINGKEYRLPDCLLFGIPELDKRTIVKNFGLSAEEANAKIIESLGKHIDGFIAPMRLKYRNIPSVGMLHGMVSDSRKENSSDIIVKSSDIVIHTEMLERANLDRWSLGHIHKPWESKKICTGYAGYSGIDDHLWNNTGFVPSMNLITIDNNTVDKERVPYSTPRLEKTNKIPKFIDIETAYWIETHDPSLELPENIHAWSRITYKAEQKETARISKEEAAKIKSLPDLFKAIDPKVEEAVLNKVRLIEDSVKQKAIEKKNIEVLSVEISGCILFKEDIKFDLSDLSTGLTSIKGKNGAGKSSLMAFCHPYPCIIGKDGTFKDFFDKKGSYVKKKISVNGEIEEHIINIQGAHTKSAKVQCYMPGMEKATFKEMTELCEQRFGSLKDYVITSFYEQPLQSKNGISGLMTANMTDIRNLVQSIAGVDRDSEKEYALETKRNTESEIEKLRNWIEGAEEFNVDVEPLKVELKEGEAKVKALESELKTLKEQGIKENEKLKLLSRQKDESIKAETEKKLNESRIVQLKIEIESKEHEIKTLQLKIGNIAALEKRLADIEKIEHEQAKYEKLLSDYEDSKTKIDLERRDLKSSLTVVETKIKNDENSIVILNKKCPECGYIDPESKDQIKKLEARILNLKKDAKELRESIEALKYPEEIKEKIFEPTFDKSEVIESLNLTKNSDAIIQKIKVDILNLEEDRTKLESKEYLIIEGISDTYTEQEAKVSDLREQYSSKNQNKAIEESNINSIREKIKKAEGIKDEIKTQKEIMASREKDLEDWAYIAAMLQSSKIPALELSLITDDIDAIASSMSDGYSFQTVTQKQGNKKIVDKFDIMIFDESEGIEKSFLKWSPGEKAFFNDLYVKALIQKNEERSLKSFSPIISDEADGPIQPERIQEFYGVQQQFFENKKKKILVISHAPDAHNYINNQITIESLYR